MRSWSLAFLLFLACHHADDRTLTISGSSLGKEGELLTHQLARFEKENPGVIVRIQETPDDATQRHQLYVQWLNAHVGTPDVLQLDVIWTAEFAAAGWILSLDRFHPDTRDFFPVTIAANRWRGSVYAMPWFVDAGMLYWRSDLMPRAPRSLDELNAIASSRKGVRDGIVWQGARYEGLVTVFSEFLGAFGGEILDSRGRVAVNSPAGVRALTAMRDQIANNIAPRDVLTWHEEECRLAFQNGTAVFMRNWPYAADSLRSASESRVANHFAIAPMPAATGGHATAALGGSSLAINAWSDHAELAYRLVAFLAAPEQMRERLLVAGEYPSRAVLVDDRAMHQIIDAAVPRPVTPMYAEISDELQIALHRALAGEADPKRALDDAARRMQHILDESGINE